MIKHKYTLELSSSILYSLFKEGEKSYNLDGTNICTNRLQCYISIFEHELVHLIISMFCPKLGEGKGGHTTVFKNIIYNLFGHTHYKHYLLEGDIEQKEKRIAVAKGTVEIGDQIVSMPIRKRVYIGTVVDINPNHVTVILDDGRRWKIPYKMIDKVNKDKGDKLLIKKEKKEIEDIETLKTNLQVGNIVYVKIKQKMQKGEILAINPSRAKVKMEDGKIWYVPYNMIVL